VTRATTLLHVLRNDLALNGPKLGCGLGQCGACTVWVDGEAARSCIMPAQELAGREITTLEGLGTLDQPHLVQQAFIDAQAAQCGYCLNGMIMMAARLLQDNDVQRHMEIWLSQLNDKQRAVVERRFGLDGREIATLEEVGSEIGVTRERVRQIQIEALRRLRLILEREGFSVDALFTET